MWHSEKNSWLASDNLCFSPDCDLLTIWLWMLHWTCFLIYKLKIKYPCHRVVVTIKWNIYGMNCFIRLNYDPWQWFYFPPKIIVINLLVVKSMESGHTLWIWILSLLLAVWLGKGIAHLCASLYSKKWV